VPPQSWYSPHERPWSLKIPGSGKLWKVALGVAAVSLFLGVLFTGDKSLFSLLALYKERDRLAAEISDIQKTNFKLSQQITELRAHPQAVEPIAREELGLVQNGEIVYRFIPAQAAAGRGNEKPAAGVPAPR
jgi:cell division protein FtsB